MHYLDSGWPTALLSFRLPTLVVWLSFGAHVTGLDRRQVEGAATLCTGQDPPLLKPYLPLYSDRYTDNLSQRTKLAEPRPLRLAVPGSSRALHDLR
jgi:hypothetical protein